jgi:hypothetical protein
MDATGLGRESETGSGGPSVREARGGQESRCQETRYASEYVPFLLLALHFRFRLTCFFLFSGEEETA